MCNPHSIRWEDGQVSVANNIHPAGVSGLLKEGGTRRKEALRKTIEGVGGTLEGFYCAFGDDDLLLIADLPDEATGFLTIGRAQVEGEIPVRRLPLRLSACERKEQEHLFVLELLQHR